MDTMTALAQELATPWPTCWLCGDTHAPDANCDPAWQVTRVYGFDPPAVPRYYVDTEDVDTEEIRLDP